VYTVVRGDTLGTIAQRSGTTVAVLTQANCLANPNTISVGQRIRVPRAIIPPTPQGNIGNDGTIVEITPILSGGAGTWELQADSPVTVRWVRFPRDTARIHFLLNPTGTNIIQVIGVDDNAFDGAQIQWWVPANLDAFVYAMSFRADGTWLSFSDFRRVISRSPTCVPRADWPLYVIKPGDSLESLAALGLITVNQLLAGNCWVNPSPFVPGNTMRVPVAPQCIPNGNWKAYKIRVGDTPESLAAVGGITVANLLAGNCWVNTAPFVVGFTIFVPVLPPDGINQDMCLNSNPGALAPKVDPSVATDGVCYKLQRGAKVTVYFDPAELPFMATKVEFYLSVPGPNPSLIGVDTNPADGVSIMYDVMNNEFRGEIYALLFSDDGSQPLVSNNTPIYAQ
jgi:LysM repeat protein